MSKIPNDELLSAYLDGEVSPEDRERVESWLAADSAARQQLDELRALSTAVQALPQHQLEVGFSEEVLRQAEREMLTGRAAAAKPQPASVEPVSVRIERGAGELWQRLTRPLAWAAMAAAAALALMVLSPDTLRGPGAGGSIAATGGTSGGEANRETSIRGRVLDEVQRGAVNDRAGDLSERYGKAVGDVPAGAERERPSVQSRPDAAPGTAVGPETLEQPTVVMPEALADEAADYFFADLLDLSANGVAEGNLVTVQVDVTSDAYVDRRFAEALTAQGIVLVEESALATAGRDAAVETDSDENLAATESEPLRGLDGALLGFDELEVVYAELTWEQLQAVLSDLSAQPDAFQVRLAGDSLVSAAGRMRTQDERRGEQAQDNQPAAESAAADAAPAPAESLAEDSGEKAPAADRPRGRAQRVPLDALLRKQQDAADDEAQQPSAEEPAPAQEGRHNERDREAERSDDGPMAGSPLLGGRMSGEAEVRAVFILRVVPAPATPTEPDSQ